jgi:hypothetical protein
MIMFVVIMFVVIMVMLIMVVYCNDGSGGTNTSTLSALEH